MITPICVQYILATIDLNFIMVLFEIDNYIINIKINLMKQMNNSKNVTIRKIKKSSKHKKLFIKCEYKNTGFTDIPTSLYNKTACFLETLLSMTFG